MEADLGDEDFGSFVGREKDIVVGRVLVVGEFVRGERASEMVAAASGHMDGAADFLILDVTAGNGEDLGAKAEFAEFAGDGITGEFFVVKADGFRVSRVEDGLLDPAVGDFHQAKGPIFVFQWECAAGSGGNIINFPGREVGHVGFGPAAEPMTLLGLLLAEFEAEGVGGVVETEVDFCPVRFGHAEAHFFRIAADVFIID